MSRTWQTKNLLRVALPLLFLISELELYTKKQSEVDKLCLEKDDLSSQLTKALKKNQGKVVFHYDPKFLDRQDWADIVDANQTEGDV